MDNKRIFELIDKFNSAGISSLSVKDGDFELSVSKATSFRENNIAVQNNIVTPALEPENKISGKIIKSPIVGTFYSAATPDKPSFVTEGSRVEKGDTVCIIEAMKMFNEVVSEFDGVVKEILVGNGDNIEYGQPLIILE